MRFIHMADVHLGAKPDANKPWSDKRSKEIWETFEKVIRTAGHDNMDLVLIAGDLFHGQPLLKDLKEVNYMFSTLKKTKVVMIAGNHDYIRENSFYSTFEWNENVYFLGDAEMDRIVLEELNTDIYGLSYHSQEIEERCYDDVKVEDKSRINILLGHGGDEKHIPFNKNLLKSAGFDYLAFGHIHKPEIDRTVPIAFAGSLEPLDVNETGNHGFIYGDIDKGKCNFKLIPCSKRKYIHKTISGDAQKTNLQLKDDILCIMEAEGVDHIYKFVIDGVRSSETEYDLDYLKCLGNILDVEDRTKPDYNYDKIEKDNNNNLLGNYIHELKECGDQVSQKALYYGTKALMDAMKPRDN